MPGPDSTLTDPVRLAALQRLQLLDSAAEPGFDRIARLAARVLGVPVCLVSLVDDRRQFFKSAIGLGGPAGAARETPLTHSFCQHVVTSGAPLIVDDAPANPLVCDNLAIRDLGVMAYLGAPIRSADGFVLGSFCVIDSKPRRWQPHDVEMVVEFAGLVESEITSRSLARERDATRIEREKTFAAMSEGLVVQDAGGRILDSNASAEKILGLTRDQLEGRTSLDPNWRCVREDGSAFPGAEHPAMVTLRSGIPQRDVVMGVHKTDGTLAWIEINTELIGRLEDSTRLVVCSFSDITLRRAAEAAVRANEERFRTLAQHAPVGIFQTDTAGRCQFVNARWSNLAGRTLAEASGDGWSDALHPEDKPRIFAEWQAFAQGEREFVLEYRFLHREGAVVWVAGSAVALRDGEGKATGYLGTVSDITARKALEANLAEARDQALEASRLKSEFLATMSHELRTPMNAVIGLAGLLADTPLDPKQQEMVRTVASGAENLLTIVNDILDFSRIEAGHIRLDPADFNLRHVVTETIELLEGRAREKGLALRCEFLSLPDTLLWGDSGRVRQILTNLVGNALKFTDEGSVDLRVFALSASPRSVRVRVEVRDTGIGITPAVRPRIFEPFTQEDGSTTRRFGGTGLGLAVSRQLVKLMDGDIGFESTPAKGSLFWFELEFVPRGPGTARSEPTGNAEPKRTEMMGGRGRRLLIAEDNPGNQLVATMLLEKMGYLVEVVANGRLAIDRLNAQAFDGLLLDCQMPVLDGYETTRLIRADPHSGANRRLPIIALTAYARLEDRNRCLAAGMDDYVTKPLRVAALQAALQRCGLWQPEAAPAIDPSRPQSKPRPEEVFDERVLNSTRDLLGDQAETLLREVVALYLCDEIERLQRLEEFARERHALPLAEGAHSLGGNAAVFGGMQVRAAALALETAARAGDWLAVPAQLADLHAACARLRAELARRNFTSP